LLGEQHFRLTLDLTAQIPKMLLIGPGRDHNRSSTVMGRWSPQRVWPQAAQTHGIGADGVGASCGMAPGRSPPIHAVDGSVARSAPRGLNLRCLRTGHHRADSWRPCRRVAIVPAGRPLVAGRATPVLVGPVVRSAVCRLNLRCLHRRSPVCFLPADRKTPRWPMPHT
jgi:hypothetical protein